MLFRSELYLSGVHFQIPHPCNFGPPPPGCAALGFVSNNFVPNPNLDPETSKYWEAGAGFTFDDVLAEGDTLRTQLAALRRLLKVVPVNAVVMRRRLADAAVAKGGYLF